MCVSACKCECEGVGGVGETGGRETICPCVLFPPVPYSLPPLPLPCRFFFRQAGFVFAHTTPRCLLLAVSANGLRWVSQDAHAQGRLIAIGPIQPQMVQFSCGGRGCGCGWGSGTGIRIGIRNIYITPRPVPRRPRVENKKRIIIIPTLPALSVFPLR